MKQEFLFSYLETENIMLLTLFFGIINARELCINKEGSLKCMTREGKFTSESGNALKFVTIPLSGQDKDEKVVLATQDQNIIDLTKNGMKFDKFRAENSNIKDFTDAYKVSFNDASNNRLAVKINMLSSNKSDYKIINPEGKCFGVDSSDNITLTDCSKDNITHLILKNSEFKDNPTSDQSKVIKLIRDEEGSSSESKSNDKSKGNLSKKLDPANKEVIEDAALVVQVLKEIKRISKEKENTAPGDIKHHSSEQEHNRPLESSLPQKEDIKSNLNPAELETLRKIIESVVEEKKQEQNNSGEKAAMDQLSADLKKLNEKEKDELIKKLYKQTLRPTKEDEAIHKEKAKDIPHSHIPTNVLPNNLQQQALNPVPYGLPLPQNAPNISNNLTAQPDLQQQILPTIAPILQQGLNTLATPYTTQAQAGLLALQMGQGLLNQGQASPYQQPVSISPPTLQQSLPINTLPQQYPSPLNSQPTLFGPQSPIPFQDQNQFTSPIMNNLQPQYIPPQSEQIPFASQQPISLNQQQPISSEADTSLALRNLLNLMTAQNLNQNPPQQQQRPNTLSSFLSNLTSNNKSPNLSNLKNLFSSSNPDVEKFSSSSIDNNLKRAKKDVNLSQLMKNLFPDRSRNDKQRLISYLIGESERKNKRSK